MTGIGSNRMMMSPRTEKLAFAYQNSVVLRHVPGIALFHDR